MKIIDVQGTMPGIEDGLVNYAGSLTGTANSYRIQTKCKALFAIKIFAYPTTAARPASVIDVPYTMNTNTNGFYYVNFIAKVGYNYYYEIKGTEKAMTVNPELTKGSSATFDFTGHHNHDGTNSPNILGTNVYAGISYAGYVAVVNANGYLTFIPSTLTLPAAITGLKLEGVAIYPDQKEWQSVLPSSAGDIDIIWTPEGGSEGTGQGGNVKYKAYIDKLVPSIPEEMGILPVPAGDTWQALVNTDSDNSGTDAKVSNWDLNDEGELEEGILYRLSIIARDTVTGAQTVSAFGYFKLEEPS